jgi:hypothetical protein
LLRGTGVRHIREVLEVGVPGSNLNLFTHLLQEVR